MVVALGALELHAEEDLGKVGGECLGLDLRLVHEHGVEIDGAVGEIASGGVHHLGDELIERPSLAHLAANPLVKGVGGFDVGGVRGVTSAHDAKLLAPERGPDVGKSIVSEQGIDFGGALVLTGFGHEGAVFLRRRWTGGEVEGDATEESFVIANLRWGDAELLQTFKEVLVDVVVGDRVRPDEVVRLQHGNTGPNGEAAVAGEDVGVSGGGGADATIFVDGGDGGIVRVVDGEVGDIALRAIALVGEDAELGVGGFAFKDKAFVGDLQPGGVGHVLRIVGCSGSDPVEQCSVVRAFRGENLAAGVGNFAERFEQEQAALRHGEIDAATSDVIDDAVVVARRIVTEEREHEAVFALCRTVAGASIATRTEKNGHDVLPEAGNAFGEEPGW